MTKPLVLCAVIVGALASAAQADVNDKSYNFDVPLHPLVNYTTAGTPYFFTPDPSYAYLQYPTNAEAMYGHFYCTLKYNTTRPVDMNSNSNH